MIWLTWRQHRRQVLFTVIGLAALAAFVVPTGLAMRSTFDELGLPACLATLGDAQFVSPDFTNACNDAGKQFNSQYSSFGAIGVLFIFLPLLAGLFFGAPLVAREVENGTHRLIWTQGVSRRDWALTKFGLVGAFALVTAVIYGLGLSWWLTPLARNGTSRFSTFAFDVQGFAPVGYTVFAVALGIFAGTVLKKVLPAMAAVLVVFVGLRIAITAYARPNYLPPLELNFPVAELNPALNANNGDWVQGMAIRDVDGTVLMNNASTVCSPDAPDCGSMAGAFNWTQYQPGSRFWLFQGIETGIYVALAGLLIYLAMRRIRSIA